MGNGYADDVTTQPAGAWCDGSGTTVVLATNFEVSAVIDKSALDHEQQTSCRPSELGHPEFELLEPFLQVMEHLQTEHRQFLHGE